MTPKAYSVMIITGEQSGDMHGANLAYSLRRLTPGVKICGIGGEKLKEAGIELLFDIKRLGIVGFWEVLTHAGIVWQAYKSVRDRLIQQPPDLLILIDFPDFNLCLAKVAKRCNIKVLYYISPQVWAWRKGRIHTITKLTDMVAVILPFEKALYEAVGAKAEFVGHPLAGVVQPKLSREEAFKRFGLDPGRPVVTLLPGSRHSEINHLLDILLAAARRIVSHNPAAQFILPLASSVDTPEVRGRITAYALPVTVTAGEVYDAMNVSSLAVAVSGTVTLEAAIIGTPMIVIYRMGRFNYALVKLLVNIPLYSLVNIVAQKEVVTELIQDQANPESISRLALDLLADPERLESIRQELGEVKRKLGQPGASDNVARLALQLLEQ